MTIPRVYQRGGGGVVPVHGTFPPLSYPGTHVQVRIAGGSWQDIPVTGPGTFAGSVTGVSGSGAARVRHKSVPRLVNTTPVLYAPGDVFLMGGQSNHASGHGVNQQFYSHPTLKAVTFGNTYPVFNYAWSELIDPEGEGSYWHRLATLFMADQGVPICFARCALGGTRIAQWQPGYNTSEEFPNGVPNGWPANPYHSMLLRAERVGAAKALLWWQGEQDANGTTTKAAYKADLQAFGDHVEEDLGIPVVACTFVYPNGVNDPINDAIRECWGTHNILQGPDLQAEIGSMEGSPHYTQDEDIETIADLWWDALKALFYS